MSPDKEAMLRVYLWDLRAQAESKLRCLTRVQQLVDQFAVAPVARRPGLHDKLLQDLRDVVRITGTLQSVAEAALHAAETLRTE
jgi:hypothetical protein